MTNGGGNESGETQRLSFVLPSFPSSFNVLYVIDHRRRKVQLSDAALLWSTKTKPYIKTCNWPTEWLLKLTLEYESPDWIAKNGNLRRRDVQNLDKLTIDTLFSKWGWDDSRLVEIISRKHWGPREQIKVTLEKAQVSLREPERAGVQSL